MSSPRKHHRNILAAARRIIAPLGGAASIEYRRCDHPRLLISLGGRAHRLVVTNTPRDPDTSLVVTRRRVRRLLREMRAGR